MSAVPRDLQTFLRGNIESLEQLELIVLMARDPGVPWSAVAAEARLGLPTSALSVALRRMETQGLVQPTDEEEHYVLVQKDAAVRMQASLILELYQTERFELIRIVSEAAMDRVRAWMSRAFADAFTVGKKHRDS